MAWPARPQDTYGLEKLYAEEMCLAYAKDFPIQTRMARYHNVYGPRGTWKGKESVFFALFCGFVVECHINPLTFTIVVIVFFIRSLFAGGREKVPAAFCRKAVVSTKEFEVWGDGKQTRSFMYIDDCVEGSIRMLLSDCTIPLNLGK